jgi:hypothetical protein
MVPSPSLRLRNQVHVQELCPPTTGTYRQNPSLSLIRKIVRAGREGALESGGRMEKGTALHLSMRGQEEGWVAGEASPLLRDPKHQLREQVAIMKVCRCDVVIG